MIYSFSFYSTEILFAATPGVAPLTSQLSSPGHDQRLASQPMVSWPTRTHQAKQHGFLQCPAYQPKCRMDRKYYKCIFTFSSLIKRRGGLCDLFNYIILSKSTLFSMKAPVMKDSAGHCIWASLGSILGEAI